MVSLARTPRIAARRPARALIVATMLAGCGGERDYATDLRGSLRAYVILQEAHFANFTTYAPQLDVGRLPLNPGDHLEILSATDRGHSAIAYADSLPDVVCAVRVGAGNGPLPGLNGNGEPRCGSAGDVVRNQQEPPPDEPPRAQASQRTEPEPPREPTLGPHERRELAARLDRLASSELRFRDAADRYVMIATMRRVLTLDQSSLDALLFPDTVPRRYVHNYRRYAIDHAVQLRDSTLTEAMVASLGVPLIPAVHVLQLTQERLVNLTAADSAPFYAVGTEADWARAHGFWRTWWAARPRHLPVPADTGWRATMRWSANAKARALSREPRSWDQMFALLGEWSDSTTRRIARSTAVHVLTADHDALLRYWIDARRVRDLAIAYAKFNPEPELIQALLKTLKLAKLSDGTGADTVFLDVQAALVAGTGADSAPLYTTFSLADRELASRWWRAWWEAHGTVMTPAAGALARSSHMSPLRQAQERALARWQVLGRAGNPREWERLLMRELPRGERDLAGVTRDVAWRILRLSDDTLGPLIGADPDDPTAADRLRRAVLRKVSWEGEAETVPVLIDALVISSEPRDTRQRFENAQTFFEHQHALVSLTMADDAPFVIAPDRASRDSAAAYWRSWWAAGRTRFVVADRRDRTAAAARWVARVAVPVLVQHPGHWSNIFRLPSNDPEVARAVQPVVARILTHDHAALIGLLGELDQELAVEFAMHMEVGAVRHAREFPAAAFVKPLITGLGAVTPYDWVFGEQQETLVRLTGRTAAPFYRDASRSTRERAVREWRAWLQARGDTVTVLSKQAGDRAVRAWRAAQRTR